MWMLESRVQPAQIAERVGLLVPSWLIFLRLVLVLGQEGKEGDVDSLQERIVSEQAEPGCAS